MYALFKYYWFVHMNYEQSKYKKIVNIHKIMQVQSENICLDKNRNSGSSQWESYRQSNCCESTRNVDDMFNRFEFDRNFVLNLLTQNPDRLIQTLWTKDSPISIDRSCMFRMGDLDCSVRKSFFQCPQCRNISRLVDLKKNIWISDENVNSVKGPKGPEFPFEIECGNRAGQYLILTRVPVYNCHLKGCGSGGAKKIISRLYNYVNPFHCDKDEYTQLKYLQGDEFTNDVLINFFLHKEFSKMQIPHLCSMETAFICGDHGYMLYEFPTLGHLSDLFQYPELLEIPNIQPTTTSTNQESGTLKPDIAMGILIQLIALFYILQKYDFSHGNPSAECIIFSEEPCEYTYENKLIYGPLTLKIYRFCNSSLTIHDNKIRLYSPTTISDEQNFLFMPSFDIISCTSPQRIQAMLEGKLSDYKQDHWYLYKLTNENADLCLYIRQQGLPIFKGSFDFYMCILGMMCEPYFYGAIMKNPLCTQLWKALWLPQEYDDIQSLIQSVHDRSNPDLLSTKDTLALLKGKHLRMDVISHVWSLLP